ncbi:MAG: hypothetical protein KDD66_00115 [Bdellovibrionales bacterium]|nr:hypothetical protein [Bdellovibrionales bacterium]
MSEHTGTASKPSRKQRIGRIAAIGVCAFAVLMAFQTGIIRFSLPGAIDPNGGGDVAELETALEEARSAAEEAATQHRDEVSQLQGKLSAAESELARLRPLVQKYQGEFDVASAARLAAQLQEANGTLSELARRYADHAILLADANGSIGAAASAAGDLDLAREFLEHWEKFQRDKFLVDEALAKLTPHLAPVLEIASGDIGSAGEARVRMEAAEAELSRAKTAAGQGTSRLTALVQATQGLTARADTLRQAWIAQHPGETLAGPTARELIQGYDQSDAGQQLAARQAVWEERLRRISTGRSTIVQIPAGTTLEKVVRSTAFANYIAEFERTYTDTAARRVYLGRTVEGNWRPSPTDVRYLQDPGWKGQAGVQVASNSIGIPTTTFGAADWKYLMANSSQCKLPADSDFDAELAYFSEYFIAMVVADVGPNGEPPLPYEK